MTNEEIGNEILDLQNKQIILATTKNDFLNVRGNVFRGFSVKTDNFSITLNSYLKTPNYGTEIDAFLSSVSIKIEAEIAEIENYILVLKSKLV